MERLTKKIGSKLKVSNLFMNFTSFNVRGVPGAVVGVPDHKGIFSVPQILQSL
jgi:hypothetical protein